MTIKTNGMEHAIHTNGMKHAIHTNPKDKLIEDLRLVVSDAEELLRITANQAGEGAATVRARIQERLQVVEGRLGDAEKAVIKRAQQAAEDSDRYVHENPWKAIGISAFVGAIVGITIARR